MFITYFEEEGLRITNVILLIVYIHIPLFRLYGAM